MTYLPQVLRNYEGLRNLNLAFNRFGAETLQFPPTFSTLTELSLWGCGITQLDESISLLSALKLLNLEENKIQQFPDTFTKLRGLLVLRACRNRLGALPKRVGAMVTLTELHLEDNFLEALPHSVSRLVNLQRLSLARNKFISVPESLTGLPSLAWLNCDGNQITFLPPTLGMLRCSTLMLSFNRYATSATTNMIDWCVTKLLNSLSITLDRLEYLPEDFVYPNLIQTLSVLHMAWNNLFELPISFFQCTLLTTFTYECNPLRSPPLELLSEDLGAIYRYSKLRSSR